MHEDKKALVKEQIAGLKAAVETRQLENIYFVSCGGSLATLYPGKYILERETDKVSTGDYSANEFYHDPPKRLGEKSLVILNSQSGGTAETVAAARLAKKRGALTAAFTTKPDSALEQAVDHIIYYYDDPQNPYPMILTIYPEVYMTVFAILDALEGTHRAIDMEFAMENLEEMSKKIFEDYKASAKQFALKNRDEKIIYTIAAGLDCSISYVLTNCSFMESIWIHSSPLHAGEFFHGAFEAVDNQTAVFAFLGIGKTRPVEERAVEFLQRITPKLTVLDAKAFDMSTVPEWTREYAAPLVMNYVATAYCNEMSYLLGHPMSSRRYMGVEKY
ncbi:SIS domain-containing protein [Oscillospiraceae bacterium PP1C4]